MRRGMKSPRSLKVCIYATWLIYFDKYLASFPVATMADKMGVNAFNETLLNIIPNSWSKQASVQGFGCGTIYLKKM